jgi:hypothetical protein
METQDFAHPTDVLAPPLSPTDRAFVLERLRALAAQRLDREVADLILAHEVLVDALADDDYSIGSAVLGQARARLRAGDHRLAALAPALTARIAIPERIVNRPPLVAYLVARIEWDQENVRISERDAAWCDIADLLGRDLGAVPGVREQILGFCADIGLDQPLPAACASAVLAHAERPYLFSIPREFLGLKAYQAVDAVRTGNVGVLSHAWLRDWSGYLSRSRVKAPYQDPRRRSLREILDEVHRRIWRHLGSLPKNGNIAIALIGLLIRIDYRFFVASGWSRTRVGRVWLTVFRSALGRLSARATPRRARSATGEPGPTGLTMINSGAVRGNAADTLVTRAQGGLGDVLMMRAGLLELARQRSPGRVVFATNRDLFSVFLRSDPLVLVDIESTTIERTGFGAFVNLTECPAVRAEMREFPKISVSRLDVFAEAMGVTTPDFPRKRQPLVPMDDSAERRALELLEGFSLDSRPSIGIQLRAAETYRDPPLLLDIARQLTEHYNVIVFDNRPVARQSGDALVTVTEEPLPVVLSIIARLSALITPDSFGLHFAGALGIPCVGLFGPTDGEVRTRQYPTVRFVDARATLHCIPCWRNDLMKCRTSDTFESVCMRAIPYEAVATALHEVLSNEAQ